MFCSFIYEKSPKICLCMTVYQAENILRNWNYKTKFQFFSNGKYFVELSLQLTERQCPLSSPNCNLICWTKVHIDPLTSHCSIILNCNSFYNSFLLHVHYFSLYFSISVYQCNLWGVSARDEGVHPPMFNSHCRHDYGVLCFWNIYFDVFYYECFFPFTF